MGNLQSSMVSHSLGKRLKDGDNCSMYRLLISFIFLKKGLGNYGKCVALTEEKNALFNNRLKKTKALMNFHEAIVVCVCVLQNGRNNCCLWRYVVLIVREAEPSVFLW